MYSSVSYPTNVNNAASQDARPGFPHSHSHPAHQGFSVAGTSNQASHSPSLRASALGASSLSIGSPLGESLSQSRNHYQPGYLMSATQNNLHQSGSQRHEDAPMVQTKAKLNHVLAGGVASDFGMDSMFESSRQRSRQPLADEDAPPTASVNDIVHEVYTDTGASRYQPRNSAIDPSSSRISLFRSSQPTTPKPPAAPAQPAAQPLYVVVFGYPPDKYSTTAEYFRSIGETTEPDPNTEISNCFRIGYFNPGEAMRAMRRNGEVLGGSWMVGVKWADPAQAEAVLGPAIIHALSPELGSYSPDAAMSTSPTGFSGIEQSASRMSVDEPGYAPQGRSPSGPPTPMPTPSVGTPLRLAPSAAAFRKPGTVSSGTPQKVPAGILHALPTGVAQSPSKGMMEQVSDLIFGW